MVAIGRMGGKLKAAIAGGLALLVGLTAGYVLPQGSAEAQSNVSAGRSEADKPADACAAWSMQSDCGSCHQRQAASKQDGIHLASKHRALECTTCHRNEPTLRVAHRDMTRIPNPRGLRTPIDNSVCFGCHISWDSLAERTKGSRVLMDKKGRVVNPHAIPKTASHKENPYCFTCHDMHKDAKPIGGYCVGCHHKELFECNTCHKVGE